MASFSEKVDRWIDALCAGIRVFEDRALDPRLFERESFEDGPTAEVRRDSPLWRRSALSPQLSIPREASVSGSFPSVPWEAPI